MSPAPRGSGGPGGVTPTPQPPQSRPGPRRALGPPSLAKRGQKGQDRVCPPRFRLSGTARSPGAAAGRAARRGAGTGRSAGRAPPGLRGQNKSETRRSRPRVCGGGRGLRNAEQRRGRGLAHLAAGVHGGAGAVRAGGRSAGPGR